MSRGLPKLLRGMTYTVILRGLRGTFEGTRENDRDYIYSVLCAVYPQASSLSALEATEALLRAGFTRKHQETTTTESRDHEHG